jgi:hypothetical protein
MRQAAQYLPEKKNWVNTLNWIVFYFQVNQANSVQGASLYLYIGLHLALD